MSQWYIQYYESSPSKSDIERWFKKLDHQHKKIVAEEIEMLAEAGNELRLPHSRALGQGLYELRERRYGYRIYYAFKDDKVIILLAAGNKTSQQNDMVKTRK